jgi:hypothetical protein
MKLSVILLSSILSISLIGLVHANPTKGALVKTPNAAVKLKGKRVLIKGENGSSVESNKEGKPQKMKLKSKSGHTVTKGQRGAIKVKGQRGATISKTKDGEVKVKNIGKTTISGDAKKIKIKGPRGLKVKAPTSR